MQILMSHPKHGKMLVFMDDIAAKTKDGWIEAKPVTFQESMKTNVEVETPEGAYEKKFGKPPHHRMKLENIIAALEE